jgi:hypothetical protein
MQINLHFLRIEQKKILADLQKVRNDLERKELLFKKNNEDYYFLKQKFDESVQKIIAEKTKLVVKLLELLHKEQTLQKSWIEKFSHLFSKTYHHCLEELHYFQGVNTNKVLHFDFSFKDLAFEYKRQHA